MTTKYAIHAAALGSTVWPGITGQAISKQREIHRPHTAGNSWNRLTSVKRQVNMGSLTTSGLKAVLDAMPQGTTSGLPYPCLGLTTDALNLWAFKEDDTLPKFAAGSTHEKLVIAAGFLALKGVSWREPGEPAVAKVDFYALSADGTTSPWVASAAAAPSVPPAESDFELDSLAIAGTTLDDISDLELSYDTQVKLRWAKSFGLYPTYISALTEGMIDVGLRFRCQDRSLFRTYGDFFFGGVKKTITLTFKDYAQGGARGTASCTLTLDALISADEADDGFPSSLMINAMAIKTTTDGVHPHTWTTAAS